MDSQILHCSTVALDGRAVAIWGPSGSGKSSLALQLIALGGCLVADDQTAFERRGKTVFARPPKSIKGQIEARGVGILTTAYCEDIPVTLAVDLGQKTTSRLPDLNHITLLGLEIDLIWGAQNATLAAVVHLLLKGGKIS